DAFVGDLIRHTESRIRASGVRDVEGVRAHAERLAAFSPEIEEQRRAAKEFLYSSVYYSPSLDAEKMEAERVLRELFAFWMQRPEALPRSYQEKAGQEPRARVICDYIAGMTDTYIYEQYEKFCGVQSRTLY